MIYGHHATAAMEQGDRIPVDTIYLKTVVNWSKKKRMNPVELSIALNFSMGQQVAAVKASKQKQPMRSGRSMFS